MRGVAARVSLVEGLNLSTGGGAGRRARTGALTGFHAYNGHSVLRSPVLRVVRAAALAAAFAAGVPAFAGDAKIENEAKKLQSDAMDFDFLGLDYAKAKDKLQKALKKCGKDKCSKGVLAGLHRDLGVVLINAGEDGGKELAAAFANDPNVSISKDYLDNAAVKKAWEAAKKKKGSGGGEEPPSGGGGEKPAAAEGGLIVPASVAPISYELPIVIGVPSGVDVASVKVSYKTDAMEKYKAVEAKKQKEKWVVILPCDVTGKAGTIKFFVKAMDDSGGEVEHYGTIKKPAQIKLVDSMPDDQESPTLPGGKDPKECGEGAGGGGGKIEDQSCSDDDECGKELVCRENDVGKKVCKPGEKKASSGEAPKLWFGVDVQIDLVFLGQERDICKLNTWTCSVDTPEGRKDITTTDDGGGIRVGPTGGKTEGGMSVATKRFTVSVDYFVAPKISIGARLGYAVGGNPTTAAKFVPFHAEARLQYFITDGAFRPYFMANAGYGMFDAPVPNVIIQPQDPQAFWNGCKDGSPPETCPEENRTVKNVTAYKLNGPFFVGLGVGAWFHPTPKVAINAAAKLLFPLPVFQAVVAPEIGVKFSF